MTTEQSLEMIARNMEQQTSMLARMMEILETEYKKSLDKEAEEAAQVIHWYDEMDKKIDYLTNEAKRKLFDNLAGALK